MSEGRTVYVWRGPGKIVEKGSEEDWAAQDANAAEKSGLQIMPDIQPYKSMMTGERITSRSHHRAHLKQHGLVEVGNEKVADRKPIPMDREKRRATIREELNRRGVTDSQASEAMQRLSNQYGRR